MDKFIREPERNTAIVDKVNVLIGGGGTAGFATGVAAARNGANVIIVERYGFLGGMCTAGYVTLLPIWNLVPWKEETSPLIGGIAAEIVDKLDKLGGTVSPAIAKENQKKNPVMPYWPAWSQFDFEAMKMAMLTMARQAGVKFLFHSYIVDTIKDGEQVKGVIIENKSGRQAILADAVVDCTGDADIIALAGGAYEKAPKEKLMPMTLCYYMGNVDSAKVEEYLSQDPGLRKLMKEKGFSAGGEGAVLKTSAKFVLSHMKLPSSFPERYIQISRNNEWYVWVAHIHGTDATDAFALSHAEIEAREEVETSTQFLRKYVPGFGNSYLVSTATQVGIRETRRCVGEYQLTTNDVLNGSKFDDVIVRDRTGEWELTEKESPPPFDIPYRCIVPEKMDNLLVAGRCISIEEAVAHYFSPRDVASCMALGEAAGTAAVLSLKRKVKPRNLDIKVLQERLKKQGANLR